MATARVNDVEVKFGDSVGFKSDVEQYGVIKEIRSSRFGGGKVLILKNENGFSGDYIGGQTETMVDAEDCWID